MSLSGASSAGITVAKSLKRLCNAAGGSLTIYQVGGVLDATSSLENAWTAVCSTTFINGVLTEVRANLAGSATAATAAQSTGAALVYVENTGGSISLGVPQGELNFLASGQLRQVPGSSLGAPSNSKSNGGFMLVEPSVLAALGVAGLNAANTGTTEHQAAWGVAVSKDLYLLLQAHQLATGRLPYEDKQGLPCGSISGTMVTASGNTHPECQPSISQAQLTSYLSSTNNLAKRSGVNFLLNPTGVPPSLSLVPVEVPPPARA